VPGLCRASAIPVNLVPTKLIMHFQPRVTFFRGKVNVRPIKTNDSTEMAALWREAVLGPQAERQLLGHFNQLADFCDTIQVPLWRNFKGLRSPG
jgi:hypothetical protein